MANIKMQMTENGCGRVLLHLGCLLRGGRWEFHWAGVRRELTRMIWPA